MKKISLISLPGPATKAQCPLLAAAHDFRWCQKVKFEEDKGLVCMIIVYGCT